MAALQVNAEIVDVGVKKVLGAISRDMGNSSLVNAAIVISGAGGTAPKTGAAAWYGTVGGVLVTKAAATALPALAGTVLNGQFNVFAFFCDSAGGMTTVMGTPGAALANVVVPSHDRRVMIGFAIIHPTGTGNFVGGTTALDDATVVPNVVYVSLVGSTPAPAVGP